MRAGRAARWGANSALPAILSLLTSLTSGLGCERGDQPEATGTARVAILKAPADVQCVRVNVATSRPTMRLFTAIPGEGTAFVMPGLPLGPATFTADAFAVPCSQVTANTVATWVSESATVTVAGGAEASVTLVMHRPGVTNVSIDFPGATGPRVEPPPATQVASGGSVVTSSNFKMIYTFGQPSPAQQRLSSPSYALRAGLSGANGSQR